MAEGEQLQDWVGGSVKLKIRFPLSVHPFVPHFFFLSVLSRLSPPNLHLLISPSPDNGTDLPAGHAITRRLFLISSLGYLTRPLSCTGRRCATFSLFSLSPALPSFPPFELQPTLLPESLTALLHPSLSTCTSSCDTCT